MMNKKGLSTVVATSLIILITIAAVAIIWTAIIPMIRDSAPSSDPCMGVPANVQIVSAFLNKTDGKVDVRVKQLDTDAVITKFNVIVYDTVGLGNNNVSSAVTLGKNMEATVSVTNDKFKTGEKVDVAPYVGTKQCLAVGKTTLQELI